MSTSLCMVYSSSLIAVPIAVMHNVISHIYSGVERKHISILMEQKELYDPNPLGTDKC